MIKKTFSTAALVAKLKTVWSEDVHELENMLRLRAKDTDLYLFIESVKSAKQHLLTMLPYTNSSLQEVPSTPTAEGLMVVRDSLATDTIDRVKLPKILYQIESDQFHYLQRRLTATGMPVGMRETLSEIVATYRSILDQLNRVNKTQQLNPIVLR